jgi:hypothetical protein
VTSDRFRTNSPAVIYETTDDETIVVNLDTGTYYDLNEAGGYILRLLERQLTTGDLVEATVARYGIDAAVAERAVEDLVAQLVEEQLVLAVADGRAIPDGEPVLVEAGAVVGFVPPVLNKYTDMQELLLLDPVHEVDEAGWPSRA